MAKSFILYLDQKELIDELTNEQAGQLFKAIYQYQFDGTYNLSKTLKLIFIPIMKTFDRNENKWKEIRQLRSEAGKRHTGNQYTISKQNGTNGTKWNKMEQMEQNGTNGTVSVSVSDSVSDSVSVSVSDIYNIQSTPTLPDIISFSKSLDLENDSYCEKFYNHYEGIGWVNGSGQLIKNWKLVFINWCKKDGMIKDKSKKEIDTETIYDEEETGRMYQYDKEGNKNYVGNI